MFFFLKNALHLVEQSPELMLWCLIISHLSESHLNFFLDFFKHLYWPQSLIFQHSYGKTFLLKMTDLGMKSWKQFRVFFLKSQFRIVRR